MNHAAAIIARNFPGEGPELHIGGMPIGAIAEAHGTPLFVYDRGLLDRAVTGLYAALPAEFRLFYSVKANPNRALLQHFLGRGCGLEVASAGEFEQARAAGCPAADIVFAGPGKTEAELAHVLAAGIGEIHVESTREIERIGALCRGLDLRAAVAVRINPGGESEGGALQMGGTPAPFGIDEEQLDGALERILADDRLALRGIHLYLGTQLLDHAALVRQYRRGFAIARRVVARLGHPLATIDFGGGLGIPYFADDRPLDLDGFGRELGAAVAEVRDDPAFAGTRLILEPGRFLVGEAGVYVVRVQDVKVSRGKTYVVTDGGMHHHLAASGNLGQVIRRNFPVAILNKLDQPARQKVMVVGPLCTPLDVLARDVALPPVEVGDLFGVLQSGAYARAASPLNFLSHPAPPEVLVGAGTAVLVRPRGTFADPAGASA